MSDFPPLLLLPVVPSGGSGARLRQLSRESYPKQFHAMVGEPTMLQGTALRLAGITLAALLAQQGGANPVLLVMPSDHVIAELGAFNPAVADRQADAGAMPSFGIVPTKPETGYGYIHTDAELAVGVLQVRGFAEKFDATTAQRNLDFVRPLVPALGACSSDSIDYAMMERLPQQDELGIATGFVPLEAGWSDLSAWDALWKALAHDAEGNAQRGDTLVLDCSNSLPMSGGRLVAGVGLQGMAVIETPEAMLVALQDRVQEVKTLVAQLKRSGHQLTDAHRKVHRPWGWYTASTRASASNSNASSASLVPASSCKNTTTAPNTDWVVVSSNAEVTNSDKTSLPGENESAYIPQGYAHCLSNASKVLLELIEVESRSYLVEDGIVQFDDIYGRQANQNSRSKKAKNRLTGMNDCFGDILNCLAVCLVKKTSFLFGSKVLCRCMNAGMVKLVSF